MSTDSPDAGGWAKARWMLRNARPLIERRLTTSSTPLNGRSLEIAPLARAAASHGWDRAELPGAAAPSLWPDRRIPDGGVPAYPPAPFAVTMRKVLAVSCSRFVVPDENTLVGDEFWHVRKDPSAARKLSWLDRGADGATARLVHLRRARGTLPPSLHAMHEHGGNYFHAVVEVAPRLQLARRDPGFAALPVLVNAGSPATIDRLLGILAGNAPLIPLKPGLLYPVEELVLPSDLSFIQDVYDRARQPHETLIHLDGVRAVAEEVIAAVGLGAATGRRRLYLRRGGQFRRLTNEAEVEGLLARRGFEIVQPGALSLEDQVRLFREAEAIVSPTGAALTNLAWCRPGTRVTVLAAGHPAMPNEIWVQLGAASGCEVAVVTGPTGAALHDDYAVDLGDVERAAAATNPIPSDAPRS